MNMMSHVRSLPQVARPSIDELLNRARSMRGMLAERAAQTEAERRVSSDITQLMIEAGLYRLGQPRRFGGYEYGPSDMLRLGFEIGRGCGSTAWCAMIANVNSWLASYWPIEAQKEIWGKNPNHLITGTFAPTGKCERGEGGYLVHGRWPFASNCENSDWLFVSALLPEMEGKAQGVGWFMVPRDALSIDQDSWHVAGMQGTGSKTLVATAPIFVPFHRTIRFADVVAGTTPGASVPENVMAQFAFTTFGAVTLVSSLLGTAQGALDWFAEAMRTKVRSSLKPGAPVSVAHSPGTQARVGEASVKIDAAMALLLADISPLEASIRNGKAPEISERVRIRRDIGFATRQALDAVNLLFEGAGASSAASQCPIQRQWRDINAAARHPSLEIQPIYCQFGQELLGLEPTGQY